MSEYEESEIEASFDYCGNFMNVDKARAEHALLRAAAAERDRLQAVVDEYTQAIESMRETIALARDEHRIQAAQLEQARDIIDECAGSLEYLNEGRATVKRARSWLAANAPAPEEEEET